MRYIARFKTDSGEISMDLNNGYYVFTVYGSLSYRIEKNLFEEAFSKLSKGEFKCQVPSRIPSYKKKKEQEFLASLLQIKAETSQPVKTEPLKQPKKTVKKTAKKTDKKEKPLAHAKPSKKSKKIIANATKAMYSEI